MIYLRLIKAFFPFLYALKVKIQKYKKNSYIVLIIKIKILCKIGFRILKCYLPTKRDYFFLNGQ